ncbi:rRNA processing/ribosome biogenesis-domain-containing protein [Lasiosphaeris hirsuta]|uniref:Pre-rRNA-processing protein RIX1 n=1 Tax=Lasiosphaeris hirsuta TaxID=260670 RepID=A0AA40A872_9PEZI|nr:rRNA processing/ribosome biogenesis-domain-containing protein [Lasiosphaeris hirsuta]
MPVPSELRVLCRRLATTPPDELPRLCPVLVGHVSRCGGPLSAMSEGEAKDKVAETPVLVHKLNTHITTLLNGKNSSGRFAAVCMVKAVIDVGGWECLRGSMTWIRGLISILQKPDPLVSKELSIVTLTKIFMLLQVYQTLVRELATPTLPSYVTACLQLVKPPASGKPLKTPMSFVDSVACSLSKLVALFPTTMRPFNAQIRSALRSYIAPTSVDSLVVPQSLRENARHLFIMLHYTAPKSTSGEEWIKAIRATIKDSHATADQVFRAVHESCQSATGYRSQAVTTDGEPSGGGDSADELPSWSGVAAGAERLIGSLEYLGEYLRTATKAPVTLPLGELLDLTARISLITLPSSEDAVELNVSIGRDEKADLWSALPDIHVAATRLHTAIILRLGNGAIPLPTEILDQLTRIFDSNRHIPSVREAAYALVKELVLLSGPTLPKLTVDSLAPLLQSCCVDILRATGHGEAKAQEQATLATTANGSSSKPKDPSTGNADAFLTTSTTSAAASSIRRTDHEASALALLPFLLSHLPQRHLSPDARGLLDRTAILAGSRDAMLASCLHPYKDTRGRFYPSILPFLIQQFPRDQSVEVLRTNLLRSARGGASSSSQAMWEDPREGLDALLKGSINGGQVEEEDVELDVVMDYAVEEKKVGTGAQSGWQLLGESSKMDVDAAAPANAFFTTAAAQTNGDRFGEDVASPPSPLKRKASLVEPGKPKRVDTGKGNDVAADVVIMRKPQAQPGAAAAEENSDSDSDSDDEGSVQIDMTLEDDEEDDTEE